MTFDEVIRKCYDEGLPLDYTQGELAAAGYSQVSEDFIANCFEDIYAEEEGK